MSVLVPRSDCSISLTFCSDGDGGMVFEAAAYREGIGGWGMGGVIPYLLTRSQQVAVRESLRNVKWEKLPNVLRRMQEGHLPIKIKRR